MFPMNETGEGDVGGSGGSGIAGDGADSGAGGAVVGDSVHDTGSGGEAEPSAEGTGTPTEEEAIVEIDGVKYTPSQVAEALNISANQSKFADENHKRAEELNVLQKYLEEARQGVINPHQSVTPNVETPSAVTGEQLQQMIYENPNQAMETINNMIDNAVNGAVGDASEKADAKSAFLTEYPDFNQVTNSPEYNNFVNISPLGQYMNPVTGFLAFKNAQSAEQIKNATAEGFNSGEKATVANLKAKSNIKVLNGGGVSTPPGKAQITADTPHGDILNGAVARIKQMRGEA